MFCIWSRYSKILFSYSFIIFEDYLDWLTLICCFSKFLLRLTAFYWIWTMQPSIIFEWLLHKLRKLDFSKILSLFIFIYLKHLLIFYLSSPFFIDSNFYFKSELIICLEYKEFENKYENRILYVFSLKNQSSWSLFN